MKRKGVVVGILLSAMLLLESSNLTTATSFSNFIVVGEKDYVNATSSSVFGGEYGTECVDVEFADLDNDGIGEYLTISKDYSLGLFGYISDGGVNLRVWHLNGNTLNVVDEKSWDGNVTVGGFWGSDVDVYQMDSSPNLEIITASRNNLPDSSPDNPKRNGFIKVWNWANAHLSLLAQLNWSDPYGGEVITRMAAEGDVDRDGKIEICVVGNLTGYSAGSAAFLTIAEYSSTLALEKLESWFGDGGGGALAYGIDIGDLDEDGYPEIVTGGARVKLYPDQTYTQAGEIIVWKYNGNELVRYANISWDSTFGSEMGSYADRIIYDVKIRNGLIFISSNAQAGYKWGELSVWKLINGNLQMVAGTNFLYNLDNIGQNSDTTVPFAIDFGDFENDGVDEIVVTGATGNSNALEYFLAIFTFNNIAEKVHEVWYDILTGTYTINAAEGIGVERRENNKDRIVIVGVYIEPQTTPQGLPLSCKHGRIWVLEYSPQQAENAQIFLFLLPTASFALLLKRMRLRKMRYV